MPDVEHDVSAASTNAAAIDAATRLPVVRVLSGIYLSSSTVDPLDVGTATWWFALDDTMPTLLSSCVVVSGTPADAGPDGAGARAP